MKTSPALCCLALILGLTLSACGDRSATSGWAGTVTDSAGVPVVTNPERGTWGSEAAWTLEEELSIGGMDADAAYQFGQIVGVAVDGEGRLYVADQQAREVRVFGPDGTWTRTIGSPGAGPGELGLGVPGAFLVDGEIHVPDLVNQRVNRYAPGGEFLGDFRISVERGVPIRWDGPIDGRLVAQVRVIAPSDSSAGPPGDPVVVWGADGTVVDTLITLPPGESVTFRGGIPSFRFFEPEPIWDAGEDGRLVTGRNHEFRLEVRGADGALQRVIVLPRERGAVTERDRRVLLDALREAMGTQGVPPEAMDMLLERATFADHYPMFTSLLVGPEGTVWAQRFRSGDDLVGEEGSTFDMQDMGSHEWDVFDAEGRYLGMVAFPPRVQPIRSEGDRIYAVARDELDVQRLAVYRVVR